MLEFQNHLNKHLFQNTFLIKVYAISTTKQPFRFEYEWDRWGILNRNTIPQRDGGTNMEYIAGVNTYDDDEYVWIYVCV